MANLSKVVGSLASKKNIHLGSVSTSEVRAIERELDRGNIDTEQAISDLQKIDKIRLDFDRGDYEKIRKEMR